MICQRAFRNRWIGRVVLSGTLLALAAGCSGARLRSSARIPFEGMGEPSYPWPPSAVEYSDAVPRSAPWEFSDSADRPSRGYENPPREAAPSPAPLPKYKDGEEPAARPRVRISELRGDELEVLRRRDRAGVYYQARSGDDLARIARRFGVSPAELARSNGLPLDTSLEAGQVLFIPRSLRR